MAFVEGTARSLHSYPTASCNETGSRLCCGESPFEVELDGKWMRIETWVLDGPTTVQVGGENARTGEKIDLSKATSLRFLWEGYPQCTLFSGLGGPDSHHAISATPFRAGLGGQHQMTVVV